MQPKLTLHCCIFGDIEDAADVKDNDIRPKFDTDSIVVDVVNVSVFDVPIGDLLFLKPDVDAGFTEAFNLGLDCVGLFVSGFTKDANDMDDNDNSDQLDNDSVESGDGENPCFVVSIIIFVILMNDLISTSTKPSSSLVLAWTHQSKIFFEQLTVISISKFLKIFLPCKM